MERQSPDQDLDLQIDLLLEAIYAKYFYDFRDYSQSTIKRRLLLVMDQYRLPSISALQEKLFLEKDFFGVILQYLTIPTTEMFRDPAYFQSVRNYVVPVLKTYPSLKVWVAGCSHGEELYSLAILFKEEGIFERTLFYATDINPQSLEIAERGIYTAEAIQKYTENHHRAGGKGSLSAYYDSRYESVAMVPDLRKNVVFADHSLATDTVFSEIHFISCRNVLIYFNRELQNRALTLFLDSLCHRGFLGLGSKETIQFSSAGPGFEAFSEEQRIFRKR
jgi:chemotaxis protein methyltransferase CheR